MKCKCCKREIELDDIYEKSFKLCSTCRFNNKSICLFEDGQEAHYVGELLDTPFIESGTVVRVEDKALFKANNPDIRFLFYHLPGIHNGGFYSTIEEAKEVYYKFLKLVSKEKIKENREKIEELKKEIETRKKIIESSEDYYIYSMAHLYKLYGLIK